LNAAFAALLVSAICQLFEMISDSGKPFSA
jgi:hypothetical protein